jgi:prepilin-type N-terminal cleavage/methylation domain-containing protein
MTVRKRQLRCCCRQQSDRDAGFTLPELLAVVVILAVLATVAVPALSGDNLENRFGTFVTKLSQDLREARIQSLSKRERHAVQLLDAQTYELAAQAPDESQYFQIRQVTAPSEVAIAGYITSAALPGQSYSPPTSFAAVDLRFDRTGILGYGTPGSWTQGSVTIFLESDNGRYQARIVIIGSTGHIKVYREW